MEVPDKNTHTDLISQLEDNGMDLRKLLNYMIDEKVSFIGLNSSSNYMIDERFL